MIEDTYNIKLDPRQVFNIGDSDENIIGLMAELGVTGFMTQVDFETRTKSGMRTDLFIPFAIVHGFRHGLRDLDLFSYAGLVSGYITGMFGGFGTDTYKNERIIENKAFDEMNRIRQAKLTPLQEAILIDLFILDHYKKLSEESFVRKSVSLPKSLIEKINEVEGDSFSGKLKKILNDYFD